MPDLPNADAEAFFDSLNFTIERPRLEWNENYRIGNDHGQYLFAQRPRRFLRGMMAGAVGVISTVGLMIVFIFPSHLIFHDRTVPVVLGALAPAVVIGLALFLVLRGRHNISIFADEKRRILRLRVVQGNLRPSLSPLFTLQTPAGLAIGSIRRQAITVLGEGWKILDRDRKEIAVAKQDTKTSILGSAAVVTEGRNQVTQFSVRDTNGQLVGELRKGVFNLAASYRVELTSAARVPPGLMVALVLVLDTAYLVGGEAEAPV